MTNQQTKQVTQEAMRQYLIRHWPASRVNDLKAAGIYEEVVSSTARNMADAANSLMADGFNQVEAEHQAYEAFGKM